MSAVRAAVSVRDALDGAVTAIAAAGSSTPRLDAELLLADALGTTREQLYREPGGARGRATSVRALPVARAPARRSSASRSPTSSAGGASAGSSSTSTRACLIPRPETELVVELAAVALPRGARVLDCCCGSGAIALALADERPDLRVFGVGRRRRRARRRARQRASDSALAVHVAAGRPARRGSRTDSTRSSRTRPTWRAPRSRRSSRRSPATSRGSRWTAAPTASSVLARLVEQASRTRAALLVARARRGPGRCALRARCRDRRLRRGGAAIATSPGSPGWWWRGGDADARRGDRGRRRRGGRRPTPSTGCVPTRTNATAVARLLALKRRPQGKPAAVSFESRHGRARGAARTRRAHARGGARAAARAADAAGPQPGAPLPARRRRAARRARTRARRRAGRCCSASANLAGGAEARTLEEVDPRLRAGVDLVLDARRAARHALDGPRSRRTRERRRAGGSCAKGACTEQDLQRALLGSRL